MVEVMLVPSQIDASMLELVQSCLPEHECERAARFRQSSDRSRYLVARALLRTVLGQRLGMAAKGVPIEFSAQGKPRLAAPHLKLHFNLSHSGDWVALALSNRSVGVDVEQVRSVDYRALAAGVFSADEVERIDHAEDPSRLFFSHWVAKEAWLKAAGLGISQIGAASAMQCPNNFFAASGQTSEWMPVRCSSERSFQYMAWVALASDYYAAVCVDAPEVPSPLMLSTWSHADLLDAIKNRIDHD